jgi:hypothetical protein
VIVKVDTPSNIAVASSGRVRGLRPNRPDSSRPSERICYCEENSAGERVGMGRFGNSRKR